MKVAVHSGNFHADDIFSVALLRLIYPDIEVIRTRDPEKLKDADFWVDTGFEYDSEKNHYDHHMTGGAGERDKIPYAGFGLVWKHFGPKLVDKEAWEYLENKIVKFIDAEDNGIDTYESTLLRPYLVPDLIRTFKPNWKEEEYDFDEVFLFLVDFFTKVLAREIKNANARSESNKIVREKLKDVTDLLILDNFLDWKQVVINESEIKFVIYKGQSDRWCIQVVPIKEGSFVSRKDLPKEWGGLTDTLPEVTGVKTAHFCHHKLFMACADTKEDAIKLAEIALKH